MTKPTDDQINRMTALIREMAGEADQYRSLPYVFAEAHRLVQELPKPVEPDVPVFRQILAAYFDKCYGGSNTSHDILSGRFDTYEPFQAALTEYRRTSVPRDA